MAVFSPRRSEKYAELNSWHLTALARVAESVNRQVWIPEEIVVDLEEEAPRTRLPFFGIGAGRHAREAARFRRRGIRLFIAEANEEILRAELRDRKKFFDCVETSPLTTEQVRAVVSYDNRVQVIAAAGSGKTSVMVARAAYAVERKLCQPDRILLLAFNKAAAEELQERTEQRFAAVGLPSDGIRASTFHSFGLSVIGQATGRKPRLAAWAEPGADLRAIGAIVERLKDQSSAYRTRWDTFRLLYAPLVEREEGQPADGYDNESRTTGLRTYKGDLVRSQGERLIADWLHLHHIDYVYERPYDHNTASAERSQYRPDFYYPAAKSWHEHWAVDVDGSVPTGFTNYAEDMRWKKQLHAQNKTPLIETTWGQIKQGVALEHLEKELTSRGVQPSAIDVARAAGRKPVRDEDVFRLMRTFMAHVKSNSRTREDVEDRATSRAWRSSARTRMFLDLFWPVFSEWNRQLAAEESVDFDDMLVQAGAHLNARNAGADYDLILVDEFQDSSRARTNLIQGLLQDRGKFLLAVGDDWQAINRFAGADLASMTNFGALFGAHQSVPLQNSFRSSQEICDVSSTFIQKNKQQLRKAVKSSETSGPGTRLTIERVKNDGEIKNAVRQRLYKVQFHAREGVIKPKRDGARVSVLVLGRYGFDKNHFPAGSWPEIDIRFMTIHASKGLEADVVIVPNLLTGTYGFPSNIADDPVLTLAMSDSDTFEHAEERRLFYVALTRARSEVHMVTVAGRESPFVIELIKDDLVDVVGVDGRKVRICPRCGTGTLVERRSEYGQFWGCSSFPSCRFTENIEWSR